MILTGLGLILLLIPFLLIFCFNNRWRGFLYILSLTIIWHLLLALVSQSFHLFTYSVVLSANVLLALASLIILILKTKSGSYKFKINYLTILAFLIIFFELWSVHYFYSGSVNTIKGANEEIHISNPYPYFSDEWVGVSLVKSAIENKTLPSGNPLAEPWQYNHFSNILVCFFALVAEIILLLSLNPLTAYPLMALSSGILICFLVYVFLKINKLKETSAILAALFIPLIVNGSNLPALWYFLPFTGGLILFLVSLSALSLKDWKLFFISSLVALLLYPPFIVFIFGAFLAASLTEQKTKDGLKIGLIGSLFFLAAAVIIIFLQKFSLSVLFELIKKAIFYKSLDPGIASYPIWIIVPIIVLPFALFGLYRLFKNKTFFLLAPVLTGLIFWGVYSQTNNFFIISYERSTIVNACLLIITAAFAWDFLFEKLGHKYSFLKNYQIKLGLNILLILLFAFSAWRYTENNSWSDLTLSLTNPSSVQSLKPNPPANQYLTEDDLLIFGSIRNKKFLSIPWKGLVIGVATNNYPLDSKASFITNHFISYGKFIAADCQGKIDLAKEFGIDYVYSPAFICSNFSELDISQEGMHLYQFNP